MAKLAVVFKVTIPGDDGEECKYLEAENFTIGRSPEVEVCLKDKGVSRNHLIVGSSGKKIIIRDLGSAFGTRVNGVVIPKDTEVEYKSGAPIKLGGWEEPIRVELFHKPLSEQEEGSLIIENALLEAERLRGSAVNEAEKYKASANGDAARIIDEARIKASRQLEDAKSQILQLEKQSEIKAREKAQNIQKSAEEESAKIISTAHAEAKSILDEARAAVEPLKKKLEDDAKSVSEEVIAAARAHAEEIELQSKDEARQLAESTANKVESLIEEYKSKGKNYVKEKEKEAAEIIKNANLKSVEIVTEIKQKTELECKEKEAELLQKARLESKNIEDEANERANKIIDKAKDEGQKIIEDAHNQIKSSLAKIDILKEQILAIESEKKDILLQKERVQEEKRSLALEMEEVRAKKEQIKDEVSKERIEAQKQISALEAEVRKVQAVLAKKELACEEAERSRQEHEEAAKEAVKVKEDIEKTLIDMDTNLTQSKEKYIKEIENLKIKRDEVAETLDAVRSTYEQKKSRMNEELDSYKEKKRHKIESELSNLKLKTEEELKSLKDKAMHESELEKKEFERELNLMRAKEMERIEQDQKRNDEILYGRKANHIIEITRNLEMVLRGRAGKIEDLIAENQESVLTQEVRDIVSKVINQEYNSNQDEIKTIMNFNPDDVKRVRRFWLKTVGSVLAISVLIGINYTYPSFYPSIVAKLIPSKNSSEYFMEKLKEEQLKNIYNPPQTSEYKDSYTENVLFTSNFVTTERDAKYHDLWIKELNHFIIDDLELKEEVTVSLVALESVLITQLEELKTLIMPKQEQQGIKKLESVEAETLQKISALLMGDKNLEAFMKFKKEFYNGNVNTKIPASESPSSQDSIK